MHGARHDWHLTVCVVKVWKLWIISSSYWFLIFLKAVLFLAWLPIESVSAHAKHMEFICLKKPMKYKWMQNGSMDTLVEDVKLHIYLLQREVNKYSPSVGRLVDLSIRAETLWSSVWFSLSMNMNLCVTLMIFYYQQLCPVLLFVSQEEFVTFCLDKNRVWVQNVKRMELTAIKWLITQN